MVIYETNPPWKMPDEEELSHDHNVRLRIKFNCVQNEWGREYFGDLMEYYEWIEFQGIEKMEHNIMRVGREDMQKISVVVMFTFSTIGDAVAFKLTWR